MVGLARLAFSVDGVEMLGRGAGALSVDGVIDLTGFAADLGGTSGLGACGADAL